MTVYNSKTRELLDLLDRFTPATIFDIEELIPEVTRNGLYQRMARLVKNGWAESQVNGSRGDGIAAKYSITAKGKRALEALTILEEV